MTTNIVKLEEIVSVDFRRWQKKMLFLLTTLSVAYIISTPRPKEREDETMEEVRKRGNWDNNDFIYRGHILNSMIDSLFNVYLINTCNPLRVYENC